MRPRRPGIFEKKTFPRDVEGRTHSAAGIPNFLLFYLDALDALDAALFHGHFFASK
jgi:hypothetical protein